MYSLELMEIGVKSINYTKPKVVQRPHSLPQPPGFGVHLFLCLFPLLEYVPWLMAPSCIYKTSSVASCFSLLTALCGSFYGLL
jgi:hypothetical protein